MLLCAGASVQSESESERTSEPRDRCVVPVHSLSHPPPPSRSERGEGRKKECGKKRDSNAPSFSLPSLPF